MLDWIQSLTESLSQFFSNAEPFFSGVNNFLGIIAVFIAVAGFLLGWWKRLWNFFKDFFRYFKPIYPPNDFPFDEAITRTALFDYLFPQHGSETILDYDIPYIERGVDDEAIQTLNSTGRVIVAGRGGRGKTRLALELATNLIEQGYIILLLKPHTWLDSPLLLPENLYNRKICVFVDGLDQYLGIDRFKKDSDNKVDKRKPFHYRIDKSLQEFEVCSGKPESVFFIGTVRSESNEWHSSGFDKNTMSWHSFPIVSVADISHKEASSFITLMSNQTNIEVSRNIANTLIEKNDGSFLTILFAFRQWSLEGISRITHNQAQHFQGRIKEVWKRRFQERIKDRPHTKYVYATLDILRIAKLPATGGLVLTLAVTLQNRLFPLFLSIVFYPIATRSRHLTTNRVTATLGLLPQLVFFVLLGIPGAILFSPWLYMTGRSIKFLENREIPKIGGTLTPYPGQVEGTGRKWYHTKIVEEIVSGNESKLLTVLSFLVEPFDERMPLNEQLSRLTAALQLNPQSSSLYHSRSHINTELGEAHAAVRDIKDAIELDGDNSIHYICAVEAYSGAKDFQHALSSVEKYLSLTGNVLIAQRMKVDIFSRMEKQEEALFICDEIISSNAAKYWDWIRRSDIYLEIDQFDKAKEDLTIALKIANRKEKTQVYHAFGHYYDKRKNFQEALRYWEICVSRARKDTKQYLCRADTYTKMGGLESAQIDCAKALKIDSKSIRAKILIAKIHYLRSEYTKCRTLIEELYKVLNGRPRPVQAQLLIVAALYALGENYDSEAQRSGRLIARLSNRRFDSDLEELEGLVTRVQSRRSNERVLNIVNETYQKQKEALEIQ